MVGKWDEDGDRERAGGREDASGPSCLLIILDERKRVNRATCHGSEHHLPLAAEAPSGALVETRYSQNALQKALALQPRGF